MSWTYVQHGRTRERLFLALLAAGIVVPYAAAVPWLVDHGLAVPRLVDELFANDISTFFGLDVLVGVVVLLVLAAVTDDLTHRQRIAVAGGALAGASVGLPLYLWLRERNQRAEDVASEGVAPIATGRSDAS